MNTWRKSSYSEHDNCVEMAALGPTIGVRDSKLGDDSPVLSLTRAQSAELVAAIKAGDLDHLA